MLMKGGGQYGGNGSEGGMYVFTQSCLLYLEMAAGEVEKGERYRVVEGDTREILSGVRLKGRGIREDLEPPACLSQLRCHIQIRQRMTGRYEVRSGVRDG